MRQGLLDLYSSTIDRAYYVASYLMRDEGLTTDLLLVSYARADQYLPMLDEGVSPGELMDRIVAASGMTMLAQVHEEDYRKLFVQSETESRGYLKREDVPSICRTAEEEKREDGTKSHYERASIRLVTALRMMNLPESFTAFCYYELAMSPEEIGAAMGIPEDLVKRHLTAACAKLRSLTSEWIRQGRIPADVEPIAFLIRGFAREQERDRYEGEDLLPIIESHRESLRTGEDLPRAEGDRDRQGRGRRLAAGAEDLKRRLLDGADRFLSRLSSK